MFGGSTNDGVEHQPTGSYSQRASVYVVGWILAVGGHIAMQSGWVHSLILRVLTDVAVHALIAILLLVPFVQIRGMRDWVIASVAVAILIDVDHAYAAGSLHLIDLVSLPVRPETHSLVFAAAMGAIFFIAAIFKKATPPNLLVGYAAFVAIASHVLRDATSGPTPWAWPLQPMWIPSLVFLGIMGILSVLHFRVVRSTLAKNMQQHRTGSGGG